MAEHTIWKKITKAESDYLGEWDLVDRDLILTIKDAQQETVKIPARNISKESLVITFEEIDKKFVCNQTNAARIEKALGTRYLDEWVGKKIQLYSDPSVSFGKATVPAIRVRPDAPTSTAPVYHCSVCGEIIDEKTYLASMKKYGKPYCSKECLDADTDGTKIL